MFKQVSSQRDHQRFKVEFVLVFSDDFQLVAVKLERRVTVSETITVIVYMGMGEGLEVRVGGSHRDTVTSQGLRERERVKQKGGETERMRESTVEDITLNTCTIETGIRWGRGWWIFFFFGGGWEDKMIGAGWGQDM